MKHDWLDNPPPKDPSRAQAYWCDMNYFLAHTLYGDHPNCICKKGMGHNAEIKELDWPQEMVTA